jgi:hypothetical protein
MSIASMNTGSIGQRPEESPDQLASAMHKMFGLKPKGGELSHYELLGVEPDETDPEVIDNAYAMMASHVRNFQLSKQLGEFVAPVLNRLTNAKNVLLDEERRKKYDETLRMRQTQKETRANIAAVVPTAMPAVSELPIVIDAANARQNRVVPQQTYLQKYAYPIGAAAALTVAGIGATLFATNSSGKGSDETPVAAAKAELNPGKNAPPVTPVIAKTERPETVFEETQIPTEDLIIEEEQNVVAHAAPAEEVPVAARPVAPEEIQLAQAPDAAPMFAATKLPERGNVNALAAEADPVPQADLDAALKSLNENFQGADVAKILELLTRPTITSSPARTKAVLEFAMAKAKASPVIDDDAKAFEGMLGNAQLYKKADLQAHASAVLNGKAKNDIHGARDLIKRLANNESLFPRDFVTAQTMALFKTAEAKKGDVMLPILAQDLVELGAIAPRDAFIAEARDLRELSTDPAMRKPANAEQALQLSLRMINLAKANASVDPVAAQALIDLAKKTAGPKYNRAKDFTDATGAVESVIATSKQTAEYTKVLESDPTNVRALQGRADLRLAQGDVEGALDDLDKSGNALAKQTRALRSNPKGTECYRCGLEWLKLAGSTMNGRKASMIVIANELMKSAKSATDDKLDEFALEAVNMKLGELEKLVKEHDVTHVKSAPQIAETVETKWQSFMGQVDMRSSATPEWTKNPDGTISVKNAKNAKLVLPVKLPADKDFDETLQFDVARTEGKSALQFIVPLGNGVTVVLNGYPERGGFSGLTKLDGKMADKNEASTKGTVLPQGKLTVELRVVRSGTKATIHASVDGKQAVHWEGETSRLSTDDPVAKENIIVSNYEAGFQFTDMRRQTKVPAARTPGASRVQTMKPVIEAGNMEPTRPKYVPKEATWNKETGSWYLMLPNKMSFVEANHFAAANSATVVVIDSAIENSIIQTLGKGENQWIGVAKNPKDGKIYDATGNATTYTNWGSGEGTNPREPYVQLNGEDGSWQDYPEGSAYVCLEWKAK